MKRYLGILAVLLVLFTGCTENTGTQPIATQQAYTEHTEAVQTCPQHEDQNLDDICDLCGSSVIVVIDFYSINDLHGRFLDSTAQPGLDELTTFLEQARETDDHALFLSAGDMWQGSAESNLTRGKLITDWMNALDFQAMALGNHEFDWGESYIAENAALADYPFLAINVFDSETGSRVEYCTPSRIVECSGVQIGLIGAIGDHLSSIAPEMTRGIYFKTGAVLTQLVKEEALVLRNQGADIVVYILHDGLGSNSGGIPIQVDSSRLASYYDVSLSDGYVDLVFEGHSHQRYILEDEYGVLHLQNGGDNTGGISHVELALHSIDGTLTVRQRELISCDNYENMEDAPLIGELLDRYASEVAPALEIYGDLKTSVPGDDLRQLIADLYYMEGLFKWGGEYDIALGGGFISIRNPGYLARGEVTYSDLLELFPFDNELVLCTIRGRDLKERFLESDNSNYFICCNDALVEDIDDNGIYYVVVDSYSASYKPNRLTEVERYGEAYYARDLLADYIRNGGLG